MIKFIAFLIFLAMISALLFAAGAFTSNSMNIADWSGVTRGAIAVAWVVIFLKTIASYDSVKV